MPLRLGTLGPPLFGSFSQLWCFGPDIGSTTKKNFYFEPPNSPYLNPQDVTVRKRDGVVRGSIRGAVRRFRRLGSNG